MKFILAIVTSLIVFNAEAVSQDREEKVRADKQRFESNQDWLYNDLDQAYKSAKRTGKPILAVLRCIPCEECVKLDDDLINNDPAIASLMKKFILLRLTSANGLDLKTFQCDTDQSFAIFFLNADKVVYGRFGTRSHRTEWVTDVSVEGMARAMEGALELHQSYPANRKSLLAKSNQPTEFATPEKFPTLAGKPDRLNWQGRDFAKGVLRNCIHCHQISEARMEFHWQKKSPIPEKILYPYPHPKSVGLILNPQHRAQVERVVEPSPAYAAGLHAGDDLLSMNGQPLISMADVQWVLHHLPADGAKVDLTVRRGGKQLRIVMPLPSGWRRKDDTSWRTGHWILRRSMLGGMKLAPSKDADGASLKVEYISNWGPFGVAQRAGVRKNDLIVSVDGHKDLTRESDVFDYINENKKVGETVHLKLQRAGKTLTVDYRIQ